MNVSSLCAMPKLHTFLPESRSAALVVRDAVFVPSRAREYMERRSVVLGWFVEMGTRVVRSSRLDSTPTPFDAPHTCPNEIVPGCKTSWYTSCVSVPTTPASTISFADKRVSAWLNYQRPTAPHPTTPAATLDSVVPRRWGSVLSSLCSAHSVEEELFVRTVHDPTSAERLRLFGSVCADAPAVTPNSEPLVQSFGTLPSPLICLRRFFMFTESIERVEALYATAGLAALNAVHPGAAYLDQQSIDLKKADIYPYPLLTPHMWIIRQLAMAPGWESLLQQGSPYTLAVARAIWETVIAPFASTLATFDGACDEVARAGDSEPPRYLFDHDTCSFSLNDRAARPREQEQKPPTRLSMFEVPVLELCATFNVPVPRSLLELSRLQEKADGSTRVDLVHAAVASGSVIVCAAMFSLYHMHRLLFVGKWVDDRCLQHATQLLIDEFLPLTTMLCEHRQFFTDASLMKPANQVMGVKVASAWTPSRGSSHPQSPNALNEHAGVAASPHVVTLVESADNPIVFFVWPASTRWLVTAEEAPSMANALSHMGLIQRTSDSYTAIQNWNDSSSTFIVFFLSKMWQIRNKTRADRQKAERCGAAHPVFLTTLLYYWWLSQLGNIPGVHRRPAFTTRMRLYSTYCTSVQHKRDRAWIVRHCFQVCRHSVRVAMYQLFAFYFNLVPDLRNVIFSHPGRGIVFQEWFVAASHQVAEIVRRLEQTAFTTVSTEHVKEYQFKVTNLLAKRPYDAVNRYTNPFMHAAQFPTYLTELTMRILEQLVSRGGLTLRAFRSPSYFNAAGGFAAAGAGRSRSSFDPMDIESSGGSAFAEVIAEHAAEETNQDAGADSLDLQQNADYFGSDVLGGDFDTEMYEETSRPVSTAAFADDAVDDDADAEDEGDVGEDYEERGAARISAGMIGEEDRDEDDDDNDGVENDGGDDSDSEQNEAELNELTRALDDVLMERDQDFKMFQTESSHPAPDSGAATTPPAAVASEPGMAHVGTMGRQQMNSIKRHLLTSLIYVPFLDEPGQEEVARKFKQMCFLVQRYAGGGARQMLTIVGLGYFGLSPEGVEFLIQQRIYHEQCLPYNRVEILMSLFRLKRQTDFALTWRYLQYIRLFSMMQGLMLPAHIARQQRHARQLAVFGSTLEAAEFEKDLELQATVGVMATAPPFAVATRARSKEAVECARFCETCRSWNHSVAPCASTQFVLPRNKQVFVARQTPSTAIVKTTRTGGFNPGLAAPGFGTPKRVKIQEASSAISSIDYLFQRQRAAVQPIALAMAAGSRGATTTTTTTGTVSVYTSGSAPTAASGAGGGASSGSTVVGAHQQRTSAYDFVHHSHRCTSDIRHRVTAGLTVLVSHTLAARGSGDAPFGRLNPEQTRIWKRFCELVQLFPHRPKQVESVSGNVSLYPHLQDPEKRPSGMVVTAVTAAVQNPEVLKKMEDELLRKMKTITETGSELAKRAIISDIYNPQIRALLEGYFTGDPRVEDGVTGGMRHKDILAEARKVIYQAAQACEPQDRSFVCNSSTLAVNMIGRMAFKPTHYTCLWENYVVCSMCGDLMKAFEWLYSPELGWICAKHPGMVRPVDPNSGTSGVYDARPCSHAPRSSGVHTASQIHATTAAARQACGSLAVQQQYFVSQPSQINGIPPQWLDAYKCATWYHAAGVASEALQPWALRQLAWLAESDPDYSPHHHSCVECDKQLHQKEHTAPTYINTVPVISIGRRGNTAGKVIETRYCQKHFASKIKASSTQ